MFSSSCRKSQPSRLSKVLLKVRKLRMAKVSFLVTQAKQKTTQQPSTALPILFWDLPSYPLCKKSYIYFSLRRCTRLNGSMTRSQLMEWVQKLGEKVLGEAKVGGGIDLKAEMWCWSVLHEEKLPHRKVLCVKNPQIHTSFALLWSRPQDELRQLIPRPCTINLSYGSFSLLHH